MCTESPEDSRKKKLANFLGEELKDGRPGGGGGESAPTPGILLDFLTFTTHAQVPYSSN